MYTLDTDTCIFWLKGDSSIRSRVEQEGKANIRTTLITACELYFGAYNSQQKQKNLAALDELFKELEVIQTTFEVAQIFGDIKARLRSEGKIINDADILIASMVIANKGILVTNNTAHFERIPELKLENWRQQPISSNS